MNTAAVLLGGDDSARRAVRLARHGDPEGGDWLFDCYHRFVLRYAIGRLGDIDLAEDVTQEVFVAAVTSIHTLRGDASSAIEGWLLGIARHKIIDRRRRLASDARREVAPASSPPADAAEVAIQRLSVAEVRRAMDRLSDAQREVVTRRFVLDQSLEEVAASMRKPVGAVKSLQHRALASLLRLCGGDRS